MNLRIARKVLRDPHRHSAHQLLMAARRVRPWWFDPTEESARVAYMARIVVDLGCPTERRLLRWCERYAKGRHDWARREGEGQP